MLAGLRQHSISHNPADTLQRFMQWLLKLDCALGQDHPALCRNEEGIAEGVAKPRQPGRQGRLAKFQAPGGTRDVPFLQQSFERDEQAEIEVFGIHDIR